MNNEECFVSILDEETAESLVSFEDMMGQHEAALLALTPNQLELLMKYADMLRRQRIITQKYLVSGINLLFEVICIGI